MCSYNILSSVVFRFNVVYVLSWHFSIRSFFLWQLVLASLRVTKEKPLNREISETSEYTGNLEK